MIRIMFHGENAASFSDGFPDLLDMASEIAVLPDALDSPADRAAYAGAEAAMSRWRQVIGDGLRAQGDERQVTEVVVAVHALNLMLDLGRPSDVRVA